MSVKNILFDLDGTLLPMDQDNFIKTYLFGLAKTMAAFGRDTEKFIGTIMEGIKAMIKNDGSRTNEAAFWDVYCKAFGERSREDEPYLERFYREDFQKFRELCGYQPKSDEIVKKLKSRGFRLVLATNPLFPTIATESRIRWAGLSKDDFELVTTYENIGYSKPNPKYYLDIAERLGLDPMECLMVGNDVRDDMSAAEAGMQVFLLTDGLINKNNADISAYDKGNFDDLIEYTDNIIL